MRINVYLNVDKLDVQIWVDAHSGFDTALMKAVPLEIYAKACVAYLCSTISAKPQFAEMRTISRDDNQVTVAFEFPDSMSLEEIELVTDAAIKLTGNRFLLPMQYITMKISSTLDSVQYVNPYSDNPEYIEAGD